MEHILSRLEATNDTLSSIDELYLRSRAKKIDLQIKALDRERASLVSRRRRCQGVLSPLRRFPNELLGEIFSWLVTENSRFEIPTKLSQICKRWREVALNSPELWTNLVLPLEVYEKVGVQEAAMIQVITTSIQRSQNRPMSLLIDIDYDADTNMLELLTVIKKATPSVRWRSLKLSASQSDSRALSVMFDGMALCPENYTPITTLHIGGDGCWDTMSIIPNGIDILSLVNLRSLSINISNATDWFGDTDRVPWSQLTSLTTTTRHSSLGYLDILRECVNLVTCSIRPYELKNQNATGTPEVRLPFLKCLKLHHTGEEIPFHILASLVAPSLEEFAFSFDEFPGDLDTMEADINFFTEFIDDHARSLQTLSVPGAFAIWRRRSNPFNRLDALKHLHITPPYTPDLARCLKKGMSYDPYREDAMMALLILNHSKLDLAMPLLESLKLVDYPVLSRAGQDLFARVLTSRCPAQGDSTGTRYLRNVLLGFCESLGGSRYLGMTAQMRALQQNGICFKELEPLASYALSIV